MTRSGTERRVLRGEDTRTRRGVQKQSRPGSGQDKLPSKTTGSVMSSPHRTVEGGGVVNAVEVDVHGDLGELVCGDVERVDGGRRPPGRDGAAEVANALAVDRLR